MSTINQFDAVSREEYDKLLEAIANLVEHVESIEKIIALWQQPQEVPPEPHPEEHHGHSRTKRR